METGGENSTTLQPDLYSSLFSFILNKERSIHPYLCWRARGQWLVYARHIECLYPFEAASVNVTDSRVTCNALCCADPQDALRVCIACIRIVGCASVHSVANQETMVQVILHTIQTLWAAWE